MPSEPGSGGGAKFLLDAMMRVVSLLGARPALQNYNTIKYGNQVTIPGALAGSGQAVQLLRADIREAHPSKVYEAGAWVLTLSTDPVFAGVAPPSCNPLIARVALGDGAVHQIIEVDIQRGAAFQIPSGSVQIDAILESPPAGFNVPATQIVTCQIHRGFSSAKPTRTFFAADPGGALALALPVPPMSKLFNAFGVGPVTAAATYSFRAGGGGLSSLEGYVGTDILAANKLGTGILVPRAAQSVSVNLPASGGALALYQFTIDI